MLVVYSNEGCASCVRAKDLLTRIGVEFVERNVAEDFEAFDFIVGEGHRTFPQIYMNGKLFVQGGYQGLSKMTTEDIRLAVYGQEKLVV